jgi:hypothetical protein
MPNSGGLKNTRPDINWLDEQLDAGLLFAVEKEDRPFDCLFEFNYQWDGYAGELDADWYLPYYRGKRRCNGTAYIRDEAGMYIADNDWQRLTRPCLSLPMQGGVVCHAHGAKIPQVVAAAHRRLQEASEIAALRLIGLTATRDEEGFKVRSQDRIAAIGSVLDRAGVKGTAEIEINAGSGFQQVLADLFGKEEPSDGKD